MGRRRIQTWSEQQGGGGTGRKTGGNRAAAARTVQKKKTRDEMGTGMAGDEVSCTAPNMKKTKKMMHTQQLQQPWCAKITRTALPISFRPMPTLQHHQRGTPCVTTPALSQR